MIRKTLRHTKLATYTVAVVKTGGGTSTPAPAGTGFFISQEGLFVTAAHVLGDNRPALLLKESTTDLAGGEAETSIDVVDVVFRDDDADFALLRVNTDRLRGTFSTLRPSARELDEGEPVYSFGYPLPRTNLPFLLTTKWLTEQFPKEILARIEGPYGQGLPPSATFGVINALLSPRTTSAIVASQIEYHATLDFGEINDKRNHFVIDKALNYGNSGGPIVATETGHVHGFASRFQPVQVRQPHLQDITIRLPSSSLANRTTIL
jgi:serine protease Do